MPFMNPALMAVGDSLFQGTRSLTTSAALCAYSPPAQIARAMGIADFSFPDAAQPFIIDLENWLKDPDLKRIGAWLGQNASY
jgi:hypothetical protein